MSLNAAVAHAGFSFTTDWRSLQCPDQSREGEQARVSDPLIPVYRLDFAISINYQAASSFTDSQFQDHLFLLWKNKDLCMTYVILIRLSFSPIIFPCALFWFWWTWNLCSLLGSQIPYWPPDCLMVLPQPHCHFYFGLTALSQHFRP